MDSTGTTEIQKDNALRGAQPGDAIDLSLPLNDGQSMSSERVIMGAGPDHVANLRAYGEAVRDLHHTPGQKIPNLIGWWKPRFHHMAINEGAVIANAQWKPTT